MRPIRLVLVDDSVEFLEATTRFLVGRPEVTVVGSAGQGLVALGLIERHAPDVVLVDMLMPEMSGFELTRLIKARPSPPLVVMMTLYDIAEYREAANVAGADAFLAKSAIHASLVLTVTRLCLSENDRRRLEAPHG